MYNNSFLSANKIVANIRSRTETECLCVPRHFDVQLTKAYLFDIYFTESLLSWLIHYLLWIHFQLSSDNGFSSQGSCHGLRYGSDKRILGSSRRRSLPILNFGNTFSEFKQSRKARSSWNISEFLHKLNS